MTTTAERLAAARTAQQKWKAEHANPQPPAPAEPSPKAGFAPARPIILTLVQELNACLSDGLSIEIDDNDLYWPDGGLRAIVNGGKFDRGLHFWVGEDGTLFINGNPFTKEAGDAAGTASSPDSEMIKDRLIEEIEYASGAKLISAV